MNTIDLKDYSPIISDKNTGAKIYNEIKKNEPLNNKVTIDMSSIKSVSYTHLTLPTKLEV